jgi:hypothetical protein
MWMVRCGTETDDAGFTTTRNMIFRPVLNPLMILLEWFVKKPAQFPRFLSYKPAPVLLFSPAACAPRRLPPLWLPFQRSDCRQLFSSRRMSSYIRDDKFALVYSF